MRPLVDIVTAVSPGVTAATRIFQALTASIALAVAVAAILDQQAMDRAQIAL